MLKLNPVLAGTTAASQSYLNTSHVKVKLQILAKTNSNAFNLNTSHVKVKLSISN